MLKRLFALFAVMLTLGLAACEEEKPKQEEAKAEPDKKVIGFAVASDTNPFYIAMRKGVMAQAEKLGIEVRVVNADEDVAKQVNGVQDLVAQEVDGILISPIDAVATGPAYEAAHEADIPIISIARGSASEYQTLHVAMNEKQIGADIADWSAKAAGGSGKVAIIAGPAGAATFKNLADGYKQAMAKHEGMEIVFESFGPLTRERGLKVTEDVLVAHPDVDVIYGGNDEIALGAAQAVAAAGKSDIIITGMNGVPPAVMAVQKGDISMTVQLNPVKWGMLGVNVMNDYLEGKQHDQKVFIEHVIITRENAASALPPKPKN